jgi:hypothetical protein
METTTGRHEPISEVAATQWRKVLFNTQAHAAQLTNHLWQFPVEQLLTYYPHLQNQQHSVNSNPTHRAGSFRSSDGRIFILTPRDFQQMAIDLDGITRVYARRVDEVLNMTTRFGIHLASEPLDHGTEENSTGNPNHGEQVENQHQVLDYNNVDMIPELPNRPLKFDWEVIAQEVLYMKEKIMFRHLIPAAAAAAAQSNNTSVAFREARSHWKNANLEHQVRRLEFTKLIFKTGSETSVRQTLYFQTRWSATGKILFHFDDVDDDHQSSHHTPCKPSSSDDILSASENCKEDQPAPIHLVEKDAPRSYNTNIDVELSLREILTGLPSNWANIPICSDFLCDTWHPMSVHDEYEAYSIVDGMTMDYDTLQAKLESKLPAHVQEFLRDYRQCEQEQEDSASELDARPCEHFGQQNITTHQPDDLDVVGLDTRPNVEPHDENLTTKVVEFEHHPVDTERDDSRYFVVWIDESELDHEICITRVAPMKRATDSTPQTSQMAQRTNQQKGESLEMHTADMLADPTPLNSNGICNDPLTSNTFTPVVDLNSSSSSSSSNDDEDSIDFNDLKIELIIPNNSLDNLSVLENKKKRVRSWEYSIIVKPDPGDVLSHRQHDGYSNHPELNHVRDDDISLDVGTEEDLHLPGLDVTDSPVSKKPKLSEFDDDEQIFMLNHDMEHTLRQPSIHFNNDNEYNDDPIYDDDIPRHPESESIVVNNLLDVLEVETKLSLSEPMHTKKEKPKSVFNPMLTIIMDGKSFPGLKVDRRMNVRRLKTEMWQFMLRRADYSQIMGNNAIPLTQPHDISTGSQYAPMEGVEETVAIPLIPWNHIIQELSFQEQYPSTSNSNSDTVATQGPKEEHGVELAWVANYFVTLLHLANEKHLTLKQADIYELYVGRS